MRILLHSSPPNSGSMATWRESHCWAWNIVPRADCPLGEQSKSVLFSACITGINVSYNLVLIQLFDGQDQHGIPNALYVQLFRPLLHRISSRCIRIVDPFHIIPIYDELTSALYSDGIRSARPYSVFVSAVVLAKIKHPCTCRVPGRNCKATLAIIANLIDPLLPRGTSAQHLPLISCRPWWPPLAWTL